MGRVQVNEDKDDYHWLLTSALKASKRGGGVYQFTEQTDAEPGRTAILRWSTVSDNPLAGEVRLLFDGEDMETEDFMAYVGLLDMVDSGMTYIPAETEQADAP
jgi:hypothetical protein